MSKNLLLCKPSLILYKKYIWKVWTYTFNISKICFHSCSWVRYTLHVYKVSMKRSDKSDLIFVVTMCNSCYWFWIRFSLKTNMFVRQTINNHNYNFCAIWAIQAQLSELLFLVKLFQLFYNLFSWDVGQNNASFMSHITYYCAIIYCHFTCT